MTWWRRDDKKREGKTQKLKENKDLLWRAEFCEPRHKRTRSSFSSHSVWSKAGPSKLFTHITEPWTWPVMMLWPWHQELQSFFFNLLIVPWPNDSICSVHLMKTPRLVWLLLTVGAAMTIVQHVFEKHFGDFEAGGRRLQKEWPELGRTGNWGIEMLLAWCNTVSDWF